MRTIAIDIGTTTIKCALYVDGKREECFKQEYDLIYENGRTYQNPNDWVSIISKGIKSFNIQGKIDGVSISSQGITIMPVNKKGEPLCNALSWLDVCSKEETLSIEKEFGKDYIFSVTGKKLLPDYSMPKIMHLNKEFNNVYKFLMPADYIYYLLCGKFVTDFTMASGTMLFDVNKREYDKKLLSFAKIKSSQLCKVVPFSTLIGYVSKNAEKTFGIPYKTPVIMGAQDQKCSMIYCNASKNEATVSIGTSTAISTFEEQSGYSVFAFDEDKKVYEHAISTTGASIKWLKNLLFNSYEEMNESAKAVTNSENLDFDTAFETGAVLKGINLSTNKGEIARALFSGVAKKIAQALPKNVNKLIVFGGGVRNEVLVSEIENQTKLQVIVLKDDETTLSGVDKIIQKYYERSNKKC